MNDRLYLSPRVGSGGVPLESINVSSAQVELLHINDRNLIHRIKNGSIGNTLRTSSVNIIAERSGERVWQARMTLQGRVNERHTTLIPLDEIQLQPGIYALTARSADPEKTDGEQHVAQWLLRGIGGRRAMAVYAYSKDGDFNLLDLGRPAFDLSDRGVEGRPAPGPVDAFVYTERGVYRPGETVQLGALLRGFKVRAMDSMPVS